jgi:hypothetical protein
LLMQRQLPLNVLIVSNYSSYTDNSNITAKGLRLMANWNWIQLK